MAKQFPELSETHQSFIEKQHLFFVGSPGAEGYINISAKGMDSLRILSPTRVLWLNLTGSGNETATHVAEIPCMTLMFVSFCARPMILRLYGSARAVHRLDEDWDALAAHFPPSAGARQIFDLGIEMVQSSCGYAIPFFDYKGERDTLAKWAEDRGEDGVRRYWAERNTHTINGYSTDIVEKNIEPGARI